jgi:hypothetical protein
MTEGDDHLHEIDEGLYQPNIELVSQPRAERTQELDQLPPHARSKGGRCLQGHGICDIMCHTKPP